MEIMYQKSIKAIDLVAYALDRSRRWPINSNQSPILSAYLPPLPQAGSAGLLLNRFNQAIASLEAG